MVLPSGRSCSTRQGLFLHGKYPVKRISTQSNGTVGTRCVLFFLLSSWHEMGVGRTVLRGCKYRAHHIHVIFPLPFFYHCITAEGRRYTRPFTYYSPAKVLPDGSSASLGSRGDGGWNLCVYRKSYWVDSASGAETGILPVVLDGNGVSILVKIKAHHFVSSAVHSMRSIEPSESMCLSRFLTDPRSYACDTSLLIMM